MRIGKAFIKGRGVILAVMEPGFLMGSMGSVVGEKFCSAAETAIEEKLPLVVVSCADWFRGASHDCRDNKGGAAGRVSNGGIYA